ncbi:hypothetical protein AAER26_03165, partial [Pseudomonas aeruginosa]
LLAAGFADFPLIAFHLQKRGVLAPAAIPIAYSGAMLVNALTALMFGRLFDRIGTLAMTLGIVCSAVGLPLAFLGGFQGAIAG